MSVSKEQRSMGASVSVLGLHVRLDGQSAKGAESGVGEALASYYDIFRGGAAGAERDAMT